MISSFFKIIIFITIFYITNLYTKATFANIVVVSYENFNETNFNVETIKNHIEVLTKEKYFIFSTNSIIGLLNKSETLPDYSVAITIASNKKQIINYIWPILAKASIPFTLFIDPYIINKNDNYMSWADINLLKNNGIEIGIRSSPKNVRKNINLYKLKLNINPTSYLYKEGIWTANEIGIIKNNNIKIAFTDNSGPISKNMDHYRLPRFNITGKFSTNKRLETILDTLPLEITDILPRGNTIINNPPLYGFTLENEKHVPNCYTNNKNEAEVSIINKNRVEVRTRKFSGTKVRINCISKNNNNRLLWHGSLYWIKK